MRAEEKQGQKLSEADWSVPIKKERNLVKGKEFSKRRNWLHQFGITIL